MAARATKKKVSNWDKLVKEARGDYSEQEPYLIDAFDPPIVVTAPDSLERTLALATLVDQRGKIEIDKLRQYMEALFGDSFEDVWDLIKDQPPTVAMALMQDINDHFNDGADDGADDLPGGE